MYKVRRFQGITVMYKVIYPYLQTPPLGQD